MSDRRYNTPAWRQLRAAILRRDGGVCQVRGPRCVSTASSVHHLVASSQAPHLFWEPENLVASCGPCNYGGGRRIAVQNGRQNVARLHEIIQEQEQRIEHLLERIAQLEHAPPRRPRQPAVY